MASTFSSFVALLFTISSLTAAADVWTVNCAPLIVQRPDPIGDVGQSGSHVHAVVGSIAFSRLIKGPDAATNGSAITCDKFADHSENWAPQLYHMRGDGHFDSLPFTGMVAYYTNYTGAYD